MKKFAFIALAALASWGLTSCDEYTLPNPPAQSNEQEKVFEESDVTLTDAVGGNLLQLANMDASGDAVTLCNFSAAYLPQGYTVKVVGQMAADGDFNPYVPFPCFMSEDTTKVMADPAAMDEAFIEIFGHNPAPKQAVIRYAVYGVSGSTEFRLGGLDKYYYSQSYDIQPIGPGHEIYAQNYLILKTSDWDFSGALPMVQTNPGDPYDNPEFSVEFTTDVQNVEYKVLDEPAYSTQALSGYGVADATAMEGQLVPNIGPFDTGLIPTPGSYKMTVDMLQLTYRLSYNFPTLYVASASNTDPAKMMQIPTDNRSYYRGVAVLSNNFWLTGTPDSPKVGFSNAESTSSDDWDFSGKIQYTADASQTAMVVDARKALYMVVANLGDGAWMANKIKSLGAVGDFQGWDPSSAPKFTPSADYLTWTITGLELNGNDFKICGNGGWGINFGGSPDNLVVDGGNFNNYGGAGKYDITLDFSKLPYTATIVKK